MRDSWGDASIVDGGGPMVRSDTLAGSGSRPVRQRNQGMTVVSVEHALSGKMPAGGEVTVRGWVRTRRDATAALSFVHVSDGSCFAPIQVVATDALANYESEVRHLSAGCAVIARGTLVPSQGKG